MSLRMDERMRQGSLQNMVRESVREALERQETQPLPLFLPPQPTLIQLRSSCRLSVGEVARRSGVRPLRVYLMEHGSPCCEDEAWRVLMVLSQAMGQRYGLEHVRGVNIKQSHL